ncbi:hypothetical protein K4G98_28525, partial [Mycobacterium tuberculosis]|nr:hypothetical protein [Mycobacterium tuberculosis]
ALLALVAVLGSQAFNPDSRFQFWFTVLTALAIVAAYFLRRKPVPLGDTAGAKARLPLPRAGERRAGRPPLSCSTSQ